MNASHRIEENKTAVWRLVEEGFNGGDLGVTEEVCDPMCVNPSSIIAVPRGPRSIGVHILNARANMTKESRLEVIDAVGEGNEVALTWRTAGRRGSGYMGLEPTDDHEGSAWVVGFWRFNDDGKLVRWDAAWEPVRLLASSGFFEPTNAYTKEHASEETRKVADLSQLGEINETRSRFFPNLPTRGEIVQHHPADAAQRAKVREIVSSLLAAEFGCQSTDLQEHVADDCECSFADHPHSIGPDGFAARADKFAESFSNAIIEIGRTVVEHDRFAAAFTVSATHTGDYLSLEPSGRDISVTGALTARFDGERVTRWIEVLDLLTLLRQLAALGAFVPCAYQAFSL